MLDCRLAGCSHFLVDLGNQQQLHKIQLLSSSVYGGKQMLLFLDF